MNGYVFARGQAKCRALELLYVALSINNDICTKCDLNDAVKSIKFVIN